MPGTVSSAHDAPDAQSNADPSIAPIHSIPSQRIVSIEHPCIIRNFDNGVKSLGGEARLKHVIEHHVGDSNLSTKQNQLPEPVAGVSLRPNDPFAKKIPSTGLETRNVLIRVRLPKLTGRRRKRGSSDPFEATPEAERKHGLPQAPDLVQRLQQNPDAEWHAVGMLHETHVFRTLPDFQLRSSDLPVMQNLRDTVMKPDYERIKKFDVDMTPGASHITAFPGPPSFTTTELPHRYEYQQAQGVVFVTDEQGQVTSKNLGAGKRRLFRALPPDVDVVPNGPPPALQKRSHTSMLLPRAIALLDELLKDRPLVTKRVAINALPPISDTIFKEATQYVGYSFKAGPWRDSLIKYGVDPRTDPKYRFYQTMMFQVDKEAFKTSSGTSSHWARPLRHTQDKPETHIFDGKEVTANGKTWQVCDVTDPLVKEIFDTEDIRTECDVFTWGWYHNGTAAKARVIMKDKMKYLFAHETPPEEVYRDVHKEMADQIELDDHGPSTRAHISREVSSLCAEIRIIAKAGTMTVMVKQQKSGAGKNAGGKSGDADAIGEADGGAEQDPDPDGHDAVDDNANEEEAQDDFADTYEQSDADED